MKENSNINYYQGFSLCCENASNHLKIAELSKQISYGIAHAHLVLAGEEAIKAVVLFDINSNPKVKDKDFKKYFSNHKYKHEAIKKFEQVAFFTDGTLNIQTESLLSEDINTMTFERMIEIRKENFNKLLKFFESLSNEEIKPNVNEDWWNQADSFKNDGFYVDILEKRGEWKGPFNFSKNHYNKGYKIISEIIEKIQMVKENTDRRNM